MATHYVPKGFHSITPYLIIENASRLVDFLKKALDAEEILKMEKPDGTIAHAAYRIGDSMIELAEAGEKWTAMPCGLHLYVPDTDATYRRALEAGAVSLYEPADMYYGERSAGVKDVSGNQWYFATHKEELSLEEIKKRAAEWEKSSGAS